VAIEEITVDDLAAALVQPGASIVDVREHDEYVTGHVPGARHVPLAEVPSRPDAFAPGAGGVTYVICRSGARSLRACEYLAARGLAVVNVAGGTMAWTSSGREVVPGDQPS
jgi:rhodanese-related sulfurtransferase